MEIREIIGIYVAQLTHVLVLGSLPNFYGQKGQFWANFCDKVWNWWLTIPQLGGILKIENNRVHCWLSHYHRKFDGGQLNSHGETLAQIGWGRSSLLCYSQQVCIIPITNAWRRSAILPISHSPYPNGLPHYRRNRNHRILRSVSLCQLLCMMHMQDFR